MWNTVIVAFSRTETVKSVVDDDVMTQFVLMTRTTDPINDTVRRSVVTIATHRRPVTLCRRVVYVPTAECYVIVVSRCQMVSSLYA
ncbi:unnamed protein product [Nippostrongylus brasiliensis]|uniref:Secreted protein n=1 Tax=Nippostrongylus brasiliensis TaxID=27835 RepID=A0A0N4XU11_NIPBR|nr:unnamed protein product [Nippostrongylus brasiliensis]